MQTLGSCFLTDAVPRQPFTKELTHMPPRSPYLETFIATWVFTGAGLLLISCRYATAASLLPASIVPARAVGFLQFLLVVLPFELCVVDFPWPNYRAVALTFNGVCCLLFLAAAAHRLLCRHSSVQSTSAKAEQLPTPPKPFNSVASQYRGIVYICTAVCIFGRDLPCWHNGFSKTYSFGTGLMDVGIGCFVVCVGLLGPTVSTDVGELDRRAAMHKTLFATAVLCLCGLVKTALGSAKILITGIDFEDVWLEYGVHWNAFYSLAAAKLFGSCLELFLLPRRLPPMLAAVGLWLLQEAALASRLAEFVLAPGKQEPHNRSNLIGQNREGLSSVLGIVPLYLLGLQIGRWCRRWCCDRSRRSLLLLCCRLLLLLLLALCYRRLLCSLPQLLLPESRRLFNPSYCVWVAAFSAFCMLNSAAIVGIQSFFGLCDGPLSEHLLQVDKCGLMYFLVSQLFTGLGNLIVRIFYPNRESMSGGVCFGILLLYMWAAFIVARWLNARYHPAALYSRIVAKK